MIVNEVAKNVEKIISIDTAKNSFQVLVVNQKTGKRRIPRYSVQNLLSTF